MGGRARSRLYCLNFFLTKPRLVGILNGKPVPLDEGAPWMTRMEESRQRPSWWRMGTPQEPKVINQAQFWEKRCHFMSNEAGMCMKTNKNRPICPTEKAIFLHN